jgi:hypothetical protein
MARDQEEVDADNTSIQSKDSMIQVEIAAHFFVSVSCTYEISTNNVPATMIENSGVS